MFTIFIPGIRTQNRIFLKLNMSDTSNCIPVSVSKKWRLTSKQCRPGSDAACWVYTVFLGIKVQIFRAIIVSAPKNRGIHKVAFKKGLYSHCVAYILNTITVCRCYHQKRTELFNSLKFFYAYMPLSEGMNVTMFEKKSTKINLRFYMF